MSSITSNRKQLQTTLVQFYNQPIAQVSVELFLSIGAIIFFAVFAIRPTLLTMSDLIKEIEDKEKLSTAMDQKIAALSTVQTEYLQLQPQLPILESAIPPQPQLEDTLKIIEKLASENQLVIESMRLEELPPETLASDKPAQLERKNLAFVVSIIGDYPAIRQYVEDLRHYRRMLLVDSIVFRVSDLRGQKQLTATLTINAPYFATKSAPSKETSK